jgi:hypothetical protein
VALQLLASPVMAQDFETLMKDVFGGITQFSSEQMNRLNSKVNELAREALKDELSKLAGEIADLRARVAVLEAERVEASAEQA